VHKRLEAQTQATTELQAFGVAQGIGDTRSDRT